MADLERVAADARAARRRDAETTLRKPTGPKTIKSTVNFKAQRNNDLVAHLEKVLAAAKAGRLMALTCASAVIADDGDLNSSLAVDENAPLCQELIDRLRRKAYAGEDEGDGWPFGRLRAAGAAKKAQSEAAAGEGEESGDAPDRAAA